MTKFGQVYEYNEGTQTAGIHFDRPDACKKCGACGSGSQQGTISLKADCKVGDWVRVEMPEGRFLEATAIAYIIPLIGLLAGIGLGWFVGAGKDGWMLLGALAGLAIAVGILYLIDKRISSRPEWMPHITAVYDELPDVDQIGCQVQ